MVNIDQIIIGALIPIVTLIIRELISFARGHQERSFSLQKEYFLRKLKVAEDSIAAYQRLYGYITIIRRIFKSVITGEVKVDEYLKKQLNKIKQKFESFESQNSASHYYYLYFDVDRKEIEEFTEETMTLVTDMMSLKLSENEIKDPELLKKSLSEIIPKFVSYLEMLKRTEDKLMEEMDKIKREFKKFDGK